MAAETPSAPTPPKPTSPSIERLRLDVEEAKLEKELVEQNAGRAKALVGDWSGVTAPTDTVTTAETDPSGIGDVHVSRAAVNVADDIADLAWAALNRLSVSNARILVVGSTDVVADCDTYRVLRGNLDQVLDRPTA